MLWFKTGGRTLQSKMHLQQDRMQVFVKYAAQKCLLPPHLPSLITKGAQYTVKYSTLPWKSFIISDDAWNFNWQCATCVKNNIQKASSFHNSILIFRCHYAILILGRDAKHTRRQDIKTWLGSSQPSLHLSSDSSQWSVYTTNMSLLHTGWVMSSYILI